MVFSSYQGQSPRDEQTGVLSKQLLGVDQLTTILINANVASITTIGRTYEEDSHTVGARDVDSGEHLAGFSITTPGNVYTTYPFELDFETTPENLRPVINNLIQAPYVFVIRAISVESTNPNSPAISDLDKLAGPAPSSVVDSSPEKLPKPR